ncbi:MAG: WD40/YVTN/BNR-like repeat-containing protein, partial [Syntrophomonadaceae bacterium]
MKGRRPLRRVGMALCLAVAAPLLDAQAFDAKLYGDLRWRLIGPFRGGWATCATGVPGDPATYYFGAAAGGVWKTEDAGATWRPIFDHAGSASVGALAVAPSNPRILYAGTGQIQARYDVASGDGVYRSDDAGETWRHIGLAATRAIGRIHVDPRDADVAVVAALGHLFGPNRERGIFRTADGGKSWQQVLFVDERTGGADLAADPENPDVLYASLWEAKNYPWLSYFEPMVGPGSAVYKSKDGGKTWTRLSGVGWPHTPLGRIGLCASAGGRVYALVDAAGEERRGPSDEGLYRSDDGGGTWTRVNATPGLASSYANRVTVDPKNRDVVYLTGQSIRRSRDGGRTLEFFKGAPGGDDYHYLWISPTDPARMVTAADQGTVVTLNGGKTWSDWYNQPTGQFYHLETDDRFPYWVYSGQQDSGTVGAATRSDYGNLTFRDWHPVGGEERGWDVPDPEDPLVVYGSGLGGTITRWDARTGEVRHVSPSVESTYGRRPTPGGGYRWSWVFPIAIARRAPHTMYAGAQYLLSSDDRGSHWTKASPDLTGAEEGATGCGGAVTVANARPCGFGTIFSIELSPLDEREIWVGTDSGLVQLTRDGGATWKNVTPPGLPLWAKVASVDASALEPGTAYVAVDAHRLDDFSPRLYRTLDWGGTWKEIAAGLPAGRFTTVLRADPVKKGLLYAGTDAGVVVSFDDGQAWQPLQLNLPPVWVGDLQVHGNDLLVATQGRAIWTLDDVSPLRQLSSEVASAPAHLFAPAPAVR